jgi:streptogramin lyase
MRTSSKGFPTKWVGLVLMACILLFHSGCQPAQVPIIPASTAALASPTSLPSYTATSPAPTNSPSPADTASPAASPTAVLFPLPKSVPLEDFQPPTVENMETDQLNGAGWTTYIPPDWPKSFQHTGEYPNVISITEAPGGTLWFATTGGAGSGGVGVYRYDGKTWTHFRQANGLQFDEINPAVVAPDGAIWFGSEVSGVSRYDGKSWTYYTTDNGLPENDIRSMAFAPDGAIWMGTMDKGLARFDGKGWQYFTQQNGLWGNYAAPIFVLPNKTLLVSSSDTGTAKLLQFDGQRWVNYPTPWTEQGKYTAAMAVAPNGDVWFAMEFSEVYRLSGNTWTAYNLGNGNMIICAAAARDGSIWFGTFNGVMWFDGKKWITFPFETVPGVKGISAILAASDESVWLAYYGGIAHYIPPAIP